MEQLCAILGRGKDADPCRVHAQNRSQHIEGSTGCDHAGSREVAGKLGPGTGFLIKGTANFETTGPDFDAIRQSTRGREACCRSRSPLLSKPCNALP